MKRSRKAITPTLALASGLDDAFLDESVEPVPQRSIGHVDDSPNLSRRGPDVALIAEESGYIRFIGHISANISANALNFKFIGHISAKGGRLTSI